MELKLNIYKNQKEVERECVIDTYDLMTGTTEDLLNALNLEKILDKSEDEMIVEIIKIVAKNFNMIYPLLHDMFGITEEEYRKTKFKEVAKVLYNFILYSMSEFGKLNTKN